MEIIAVILLIVIVIMMFNHNGNISGELTRIREELRSLRSAVKQFETDKTNIQPKKEVEQPKLIPDEKKYWEPGFKVVEEPVPLKPIPDFGASFKEEKTEEKKEEPKEILPVLPEIKPVENVKLSETISTPVKEPFKIPVAKPTFFERHPDMEKFIGENLISKIGIAVLVLAIGFFVKYAIDNNWIGPVGRVAIGVACGGILVGLAHYLRNNYKSFSSVLAGGGLAVFYFTITLAYQKFQLFGQVPAFIIMLVITVFAVLLSILYNRQELAIIAMLGGFASPFLVSDGTGNYITLFTYLIVLNAGLLIIAYNKAWRLLNVLCFFFTVILFGGWLAFNDFVDNLPWRNGFIFATVFYLLYFLINIAHNIREQKKFIASDFGILLANTCLYFSAGIFCLTEMNLGDYQGLFTASIGLFNLVASYFLFRKRNVDSNILYLLTGITLTFVSLTAPIQLHGNNITLFWASETVLLYWLFKKSGIGIIKYASALIWLLALVSLVLDWEGIYTSYETRLPVIINKGFITSVFLAVATWCLFLLKRKEDPAADNQFLPGRNLLRIVALLILYSAGALEINFQFRHYYPDTSYQVLYLLLYTMLFIIVFEFITNRVASLRLNWKIIAILLSVAVIFYLLVIPVSFDIQKSMLETNKPNGLFAAHWISAILAGLILYKLVQLVRVNRALIITVADTVTWVLCTIIVVWLSLEGQLLSNMIFYAKNNPLEDTTRIYIKTGLPILWGICSFVFMWLGMHYKYKTLRIISLSLFTLTLLKLFLFDISNIPAGGKIAAFFCLGVLLLVVSFMYQRLKKIIIEDEEKTA